MTTFSSKTFQLRKDNPCLSYCRKCGTPWNYCENKTVMITEKHGKFAVCQECWEDSTIEELQAYYRTVYYNQESQSDGKMEHSLEMLLEAVKKEKNER